MLGSFFHRDIMNVPDDRKRKFDLKSTLSFIDNITCIDNTETRIWFDTPLQRVIGKFEYGDDEFCVQSELLSNIYISKAILNTLVFVDDFPVGKIPFDEDAVRCLISRANPALFGKGNETVFDPSVRRAKSINGQHFTLTAAEENEYHFTNFADFLKFGMPGRDSQKFDRMEFQKIHIYQEGDFFLPHVDTVTEANHVGTLVWVLPTPHTGGELVISHDGKQVIFDSAKLISEAKSDEKQQFGFYCYFYSDCLHEVKPVKSGIRVALQFKLLAGVTSTPKGVQCVESVVKLLNGPPSGSRHLARRFFNTLKQMTCPDPDSEKADCDPDSEEADWDPIEDQDIGIILSHLYANTGVKPEYLKGRDLGLYNMLQEAGVESLELFPVVIYKNDPFEEQTTYHVGSLDIESGDVGCLPSQMFVIPSCPDEMGQTVISQVKAAQTGNEAQDGYTYYVGAMISFKNPFEPEDEDGSESDQKKQKLDV